MGYKSPRNYEIPIGFSNTSPADSSTYFVPFIPSIALGTTWAANAAAPLISGIVRGVALNIYAAVIGTAETITCYVRINDTTDYLVGTVATATDLRTIRNAALNIPIKTTDVFALKLTTPAWVTNPDGVRGGGLIFIEFE